MPDGSNDTLLGAETRWLAAFEQALGDKDAEALRTLFRADSHWRDLLALTWDVQTLSGAETLIPALIDAAAKSKPENFAIAVGRTPPRRVTRVGKEVSETIFSFHGRSGPGIGVLRLTPPSEDGALPQAWTFLTALDALEGHSETAGTARPSGEKYSRDFSGPNWLDERFAALRYDDRDPAVLIIGGGQAGLSIAARLKLLGVDALIIDREKRIGDNWRNRYHALTLHNQVHVNHLPYMPFPPNWPKYIPKDKIAGWFEAYVDSLELNVWTKTEFESASYDESTGCWTARLKRDDNSIREMRPHHIVMATGVSGIPNLPEIPGLDAFRGNVIHSSGYSDAEKWAGRDVVIIGSGNSGHDIAQDLHSHGARVTMVQRSPTTIVNIEPSAQLPYALYEEGPPLEDCDLITASMPLPLTRQAHRMLTERTREIDKELLDGLARVGFKTDFGEDGTGWQFKYLERGGGYYFNVGCSDLIVSGKVGLIQHDDIAGFSEGGVALKNGGTVPADLIVLATGFKGQEQLVRKLFGETVADRVGGVWGFDPDLQELRSMWTRTGQPGLWFIGGSFAQCRIYSKVLGLQIKACEEGLLALGRA
jgi:cation diffusion facilitator CzcD-associated flavoprotein CzcO